MRRIENTVNVFTTQTTKKCATSMPFNPGCRLANNDTKIHRGGAYAPHELGAAGPGVC